VIHAEIAWLHCAVDAADRLALIDQYGRDIAGWSQAGVRDQILDWLGPILKGRPK